MGKNIVSSLENLKRNEKYASVSVGIHWGKLLLKSINEVMSFIDTAVNDIRLNNVSGNFIQSIKSARVELGVSKTYVEQIIYFLEGYKSKYEPSRDVDLSTDDWGFTEKELEILEKLKQQDLTPEEKIKLIRTESEKEFDDKSEEE